MSYRDFFPCGDYVLSFASAYVSRESNDGARATMCQREGCEEQGGKIGYIDFLFYRWKFRNRAPKGSRSIKDGRREAERGMYGLMAG